MLSFWESNGPNDTSGAAAVLIKATSAVADIGFLLTWTFMDLQSAPGKSRPDVTLSCMSASRWTNLKPVSMLKGWFIFGHWSDAVAFSLDYIACGAVWSPPPRSQTATVPPSSVVLPVERAPLPHYSPSIMWRVSPALLNYFIQEDDKLILWLTLRHLRRQEYHTAIIIFLCVPADVLSDFGSAYLQQVREFPPTQLNMSLLKTQKIVMMCIH